MLPADTHGLFVHYIQKDTVSKIFLKTFIQQECVKFID